ncbi:MAG: DUF1460 domain-containing protein [Spirosomataceae bacterium]
MFAQQSHSQYPNNLPKSKGGTALLQTAKTLLGKPYVAGVLDRNPKEQLIVNLDELDCWTFVEQTLALYQTQQSPTPNWTTFRKNLQQLRYRQGKVNGYGSRLHYFFEWMLQAQQNSVLSLKTNNLTGKPYAKRIDFMSTHVQLYPHLADQEAYETVMAAEANLNLQQWYYVPKAEVAHIENQLEDGDIIAITSAKEGLDVAHEGFAIRQKGRIYLLHASQDFKKVMISNEPLADYLAKHKAQTGIVVARLQQ